MDECCPRDNGAPSPKRRRQSCEENIEPNVHAQGSVEIIASEGKIHVVSEEETRSSCTQVNTQPVARSLSADQISRIEQNRLAALQRKQKAESQAAADKGNMSAEQRARIEQNRLAALQRKQQRLPSSQEAPLSQEASRQALSPQSGDTSKDEGSKLDVQQQPVGSDAKSSNADSNAESSSTSSTPSLPSVGSQPFTPLSVSAQSGESVMESDAEDSSSHASSASDESSSSDPSSSTDSQDRSDSNSESEQPEAPHQDEHRAETEQNREALQRRGLKPEQIAQIEENRRRAMAKKSGLSVEQKRRIEGEHAAAEVRKEEVHSATPKAANSLAQDVAQPVAKPDEVDGVPTPKPPEERDAKQKLVATLLCRWWYVLPPWPPEDYKYDDALAHRNLRRVSVNNFHNEAEFDERGFQNVYELTHFRGLFRAANGTLFDLRPIEGRPSYDQLMLKSKPELYRLLIAAYDAQLQELLAETNKKSAPKELEEHLRQTRHDAAQVRQKATFYLAFAGKTSSVRK
jgi:hypothetical protein